MDHFEDVMQYQHLSSEFSKDAKFHKNPLQTHENMGPQTCNFFKDMYSSYALYVLGNIRLAFLFVILGIVTKLGMINRVTRKA